MTWEWVGFTAVVGFVLIVVVAVVVGVADKRKREQATGGEVVHDGAKVRELADVTRQLEERDVARKLGISHGELIRMMDAAQGEHSGPDKT